MLSVAHQKLTEKALAECAEWGCGRRLARKASAPAETLSPELSAASQLNFYSIASFEKTL